MSSSPNHKPFDYLPQCWEIMKCGREKGGANVDTLGECIASKENMGRSCWAIAGTYCDGEIQGTFAQKRKTCMSCLVLKKYNRISGPDGENVKKKHPEEQAKYLDTMKAILKKKPGY